MKRKNLLERIENLEKSYDALESRVDRIETRLAAAADGKMEIQKTVAARKKLMNLCHVKWCSFNQKNVYWMNDRNYEIFSDLFPEVKLKNGAVDWEKIEALCNVKIEWFEDTLNYLFRVIFDYNHPGPPTFAGNWTGTMFPPRV